MEGSTVLGSSYGCRPRNVTQSKYIHIYHNVYVLCVSGRRQTFCSCGLPSSELMCVHALCALLRPLLGQAPNPESGLTVVFRARCGLTSSRAYVLSGGCSAGVISRFCVGLSPRPAALRSAAFALNARPLAGCRPRPLFRLSVVLFPPVPDDNKCLLLSGTPSPLTPARVTPAGGRCFSWYLCGLWPCVGNFPPMKFSRFSDKGATAKPLVR